MMRTVVSMLGMTANPESLLARAAFLVETRLPMLADTLRLEAEGVTDLAHAVRILEYYGFHVVGHVQNVNTLRRFNEYTDPERRVQVKFYSMVQPNAGVTLVVSEPEVAPLVQDFESSGHWCFLSAIRV